MSRGAVAVSAVAVLVSAGAVTAASRVDRALPDPARPARTVAVSTAVLTCPGAREDAHSRATVFAATAGARAQRGGGALAVAPLTSGARSQATLTKRQHSLTTSWRPGLDAAVLRAVGSLAPGAAAFQWSLPRGAAASGGSAAAQCLPAGADWWFAGASTAAGATSTLVLTNPSSSVAVVDLAFFGPAGPLVTPGSRGVAVAPRSSRSITLSSFAPGLTGLTVNVHAEQGLVGAAVHVSRSSGTQRRGSEWLPAADPPSTDVLVEPAAAAGPDRRLVVTNPTAREALAQVEVIDTGGEFTPVGFTDVRLAPGSVRRLRLGRTVAGSAAAVHLTSSSSVVAAIVATRRGRGDFAVTTSGPELQQPALVPVVAGTVLSLRIASTSRPGSAVTIETFTRRGRSLGRQRVAVTGRAVTGWRLRDPAGRAAYLVASPEAGSAGVYAVAHYSSRAGITALALRPATYTVVRPAVAATVTTQ